MVLGAIVPAFAETATTTAAEMTAGEKLEAYNVIDGTDKGLEEDQPLTRAAMAVVIAQMYGEKAIAMDYAFEPTFTDMEEGAWYIPYVAYAENKGWMVGGGAGTTFRPNDVMTAQEVNAMFLKALGYTVEWADVNTEAEAMGFGVVAADATLVLRGEAFTAVVAALDVMPKDGTETLGTVLALEGYTAPVVEVPVVDLAVESVTAHNLKEVVVTFNTEGDATLIGNKDNYTVNTVAPVAAKVAADNMTVTLTLNAAILQQGDMEVKVLKATGIAADTTMKAESVIDTMIPVAEAIKLTGPKTMDVTFSEPVKDNGAAAVVINNGLYGVSSKVLSTDGRTLTITIAATLNDATDYEVKVSNYEDYAGFDALAKTFTVTYVKDMSAPTATLKSATQTEVVFVFDKAVTQKGGAALDANYFYHTYTAWKPVSVTTTDNKTFTLAFKDANPATTDYYLPVGNSTVYILATASDVVVVDAWGNEFAGANFVATVTADTTAPVVTKVEATLENQLKVTFDEEVTTVATNYTIKDSAAEAADTGLVTFGYTTKVATLDFAKKLAGGTYTVEIKGVKDTALATNAMDTVTLEFVVSDKTPATVTATVVETLNDTNAEYIYLTYSENMDTTTTLNAANYQLDGVALPSTAKVEAFMGTANKVKITVPDQTGTLVSGATSRLTVGQVKDAAGNAIVKLATEVTIIADTAPQVTNVKSLGLNKVEINVTGLLDVATVTTAGMTIETAGGPLALAAIDSVTKTTTATKVVAFLQADEVLTGPADVVDAAVLVGGAWKSETGKAAAIAGGITYTDGIAPSFSSITQVDNDQFTITFDETLDPDVLDALIATDLVITKADGTVLVAGVDYTVAENLADIDVTLTTALTADETLTVATVAAPVYIKDADKPANGATAGINKLNAFSKTLAMDLTAPSVTARTSTTLTNVVVTLSEKLNAVDGADIKAAFSITDTDTSGAVAITTAIYDDTAMTITFTIGAGVTATDLLVTDGSLTDVYGNVFAAGTVATADATDLAQ
jgi:hypothetical protein